MEKHKFNCPAEMTVHLVGGKWKMILIYNLRNGAKRFGELKRNSPGITSATLTKELKSLEKNGLVKRTSLNQDRLLGVEYTLTDRGVTLKPVMKSLIRWGLENQKHYVMGDFGMAKFQKSQSS